MGNCGSTGTTICKQTIAANIRKSLNYNNIQQRWQQMGIIVEKFRLNVADG